LATYRSVLAERGASPVLLSGSQSFDKTTDWVLSFERANDIERRYCVYNFGHHDEMVTLPADFAGAELVDAFSRNAELDRGKLTLKPLGYAMLKRGA
jgi:Maltogenic Amylase, C-terminal domain